MVIVFQQRKLFYHQRERKKKSCVIGEAKAIFFLQVIKNKIQYFVKIISYPSIKKLKFSLFLIILDHKNLKFK